MAYIYKIYNDINEKIYIGKTTRTAETRFKEHCRGSNNYNSYIDNSIQKYGSKHFFYEIIEKCEEEVLNERERYWISFFNCQAPNGYNLTPGGDGRSLSNKEIEQITNLYFKENKSITEIEKILNLPKSTIYHRLSQNENFNKEENKNKSYSAFEKSIDLYSLEGKFLKTYKSINEMCRKNNLSNKGISEAIKKGYCIKNFRFAYQGEKLIISNNKKPVLQFSFQGELIASYGGAREAARENNINSSSIIRACGGKITSSIGYVWIYLENYSDELLLEKIKKAQSVKEYRKKEYQ